MVKASLYFCVYPLLGSDDLMTIMLDFCKYSLGASAILSNQTSMLSTPENKAFLNSKRTLFKNSKNIEHF